jgi:hypothetical protein
MNWGEITGGLSLIVSAVLLYIAWKKWPHEISQQDVSTANEAIATARQALQSVREVQTAMQILRRQQRRRDEVLAAWSEGFPLVVEQLRKYKEIPVWMPELIDWDTEDERIRATVEAEQTRPRKTEK